MSISAPTKGQPVNGVRASAHPFYGFLQSCSFNWKNIPGRVYKKAGDLILLPLDIAFVLKMIPPVVLAECPEEARKSQGEKRQLSWIAALVIASIWLASVFFIVRVFNN
jgi:hypothetical protein